MEETTLSVEVEQNVKNWLTTCVIELNLCPFAAKPYQDDKVRIVQSDQRSIIECAYDFKNELEYLLATPVDELETTLLVYKDAFADFDGFWEFVQDMNDILEDNGLLDEEVQLASFHPAYLFEGEETDARSNYTNRAPYPIIHMIRQRSMKYAIEAYGERKTEEIPFKNIDRLNTLSYDEFERCFLNRKV